MNQKINRTRQSVGLAVRIIISSVIIAVIIWKYNDLVNIDMRMLIDSSNSEIAAVGSILGVYLLKAVLFVIPASIVYTAVGVAFDVWIAIAINAAGILIEVCATWLLGRILGGDNVEKLIARSKKGQKILKIKDKKKYSAIFGIRAVPVFPIDFVSLFLGASKMKFVPYLLISFFGIMPRVILFTVLGNSIYDYIPMKYIVIGVIVIVFAALIAWVVRYALKIKNGQPIKYTPVTESRRDVILETDIGPDCDDAGAVAVLINMLDKIGLKPLGIVNCTSNKYSNGVLHALLDFLGAKDVPVLQTARADFFENDSNYAKKVAEKYFDGKPVLSAGKALDFYLETLSNAQDDSVVIISTGMLNGISDLIDTYPVLVEKKVHAIVAMAGKFPNGKEFNITSDIKSAQNVFEKFPNTIICSGFEVGASFKTGFLSEPANAENNPIYACYKTFTDHDISAKACVRESWDLTAVEYAIEGEGEFYTLSDRMKFTVDDSGEITAKRTAKGNHCYLIRKGNKSEHATRLNKILREYDEVGLSAETEETQA